VKAVIVRSALLSGVLALSFAPLAQATSSVNQTAVDNGITFLNTKVAADGHVGASASETGWSAIAYAAAGSTYDTVQTAGGTDLLTYLMANPPSAAASATDWERSILAITADHHNPYNFGGTDYVAKLKTFVSAGQIGSATASNDDYFGLMALMAAGIDPADSVAANEITYILGQQKADGGFSYSTDPSLGSDVDDTAAALMALEAAKFAGQNQNAFDAAVAKATAYMLGTQNADGGFPYDPLTPPAWGGPVSNVSTTSWVVMALTALGQDSGTPYDDAQAYIRGAQNADGSFPYEAPAAGDVFDTAPAVTALAGGTYPFKVYNGVIPDQDPVASPTPTPTPTPMPTPTPDVLGASIAPTPTPTPAVLGASTGVLPTVGELSNYLLLLMALAIATAAGVAVYLRQRRRLRNQA